MPWHEERAVETSAPLPTVILDCLLGAIEGARNMDESEDASGSALAVLGQLLEDPSVRRRIRRLAVYATRAALAPVEFWRLAGRDDAVVDWRVYGGFSGLEGTGSPPESADVRPRISVASLRNPETTLLLPTIEIDRESVTREEALQLPIRTVVASRANSGMGVIGMTALVAESDSAPWKGDDR